MARAVRIVVSGHVQGVGFRAYVLCLASTLGFVGEVRNRSDGRVELVAQHDSERLFERLTEELRRGPGSVDSVDVFDHPVGAYPAFTIGFTR